MHNIPSTSPADEKYSPEMLEFIRHFNAYYAADKESDDVRDQLYDAFSESIGRLVAADRGTWQHAGELSIVWRLRSWDGDECVGTINEPEVERALWKCIEKLTSMSMRGDAATEAITLL